MRTYTIDATNIVPGRIATEAAVLLMGKDSPDFAKNVVAPVRVKITNASKIKIHPKKLTMKEYVRYSGYPSGLKKEPLGKLANRKGNSEIITRAVYGMLPANKLRKKIMSNLEITE